MTFTLSPLIILFGAELILLIIAFAIFMAVSRHKYKKLYKKLLSVQQGHPVVSAPIELPEEAPVVSLPSETALTADNQRDSSPEEAEMATAMPLDEKDDSDVPMSEDRETSAGLQKLKKVVDFQKEKIVNLMCYKDILESAQKKLTNIHTDYEDLAQRFASISEAIGSNKEFELALEMFGENTTELKDFIEALHQENDSLLDKLNAWEGQLKEMWKESEEISAEAASGSIEEILAEKNEMLEKIKEFENKFKEKSKQLEEAQAQYEDLEKEYMILYKQQQTDVKK